MGRMLNSRISSPLRNQPASTVQPRGMPNDPLTRRAPGDVPTPRGTPTTESETTGFRKLAFKAGLGMLFVRFAGLPELLAALLHVNTYLLYLVGPPSILGALVTGGIGRTLRHRAAWMWIGFFACMLLALPFSSWVGGSVPLVKNYALFSFPLLFVVGGLTVTWRNVRATFATIGSAGVFFIWTASLLAKNDAEGRLTMTDTTLTIGNSNDLASHLILVLPFILFLGLNERIPAVLRFLLLLPSAYAFKIILGTASRGAVVAMAVAFLFVLFRASAKHRIVAMAAVGVMAVAAPLMINGNALERLGTLFGKESASSNAELQQEARESQQARQYLLMQSLRFSIEHPVFGVGLGQFPNFVGKTAKAEGIRGQWNETHNTFTQVSSELGLPAVTFFILGIAFSFTSVSKTYRKARREGYTEIANTCFCYLLAMVAYIATIVFLANAYRFYLPAMIGLAIALKGAAEREMSASLTVEPHQFNGWSNSLPVRGRAK
jgi:O-antigen ligase